MDMRFENWNFKSIYSGRTTLLKTVTKELAKSNSDLPGVKEVRVDKVGGTEPADSNTFFYENDNANYQFHIVFSVHEGIITASGGLKVSVSNS